MESMSLNQNSWICKSNKLVNATYKLCTGEQKLILAISSMVNPLDKDFKEYIVSIQDFSRLLDVNLSTNKSFYSRVKRASSVLLSKRLTIREDDGDFQTQWLSGIKYYDKEGKVAVSFHPRLKAYYLQLKKYTKYRLKNVISLKSEYSIKLYEALKQYEKVGERLYKLSEFKMFMGVEKQYDRFYDLKKRILLVAQKELEEKTDIKFEFKELKKGKSVVAIKFEIHKNKINEDTKEVEDVEPCKKRSTKTKKKEDAVFEEEKYKVFEGMDFTIKQQNLLLEDSKDNLDLILRAYRFMKNSRNMVKNKMAFMRDAIKNPEKYIESERFTSDSNSTFNNFKQRNYNFKDLERKLLGWDTETDSGEIEYKQAKIEV